MKYFSMFSGIGGFEKGIDQAHDYSNQPATEIEQIRQGWDRDTNETGSHVYDRSITPLCVGYSEIDKYAIKVYERQFNGHKNYGDATAINATELPDFDLLVGGFPCQAFSIAGKRAGFNETRGTLFFDIARILKEKQPRHLVLENVKGLLSHDSGRTFTTIIGVLTDLGYCVEWQVLNSKDFGVPQNRERVYIIGHLGNECGRKVFPLRQDGRTANQRFEGGIQQVTNTLRARDYASWRGNHIQQLNSPKHSNDRVYGETGISPTLNTMQGGARQPFIAPVLTPNRLVKRQNGRRMKNNGEPAFTVTSQDQHGIYDGAKIRRLTPKECERLQGFPDDWTKKGLEFKAEWPKEKGYLPLDVHISDSQRYKMCGNAVTVNVVEAVMRGLLNHG